MFGGGTPSTKKPEFWDGDQPWTTSAVIQKDDIYLDRYQRCITEEGLVNSSSNMVPKGGILIGTRVGVGKAVVATFDIAISQDLTGFIPVSDVEPGFLVLSLKQQSIQNGLKIISVGLPLKGCHELMLPTWIFRSPPSPNNKPLPTSCAPCSGQRRPPKRLSPPPGSSSKASCGTCSLTAPCPSTKSKRRSCRRRRSD